MKNAILTILILILMVLGVSGCGTKADKYNDIFFKEPVNKEEHHFKAEVIEVHDGYIIVKPNEDEEERKSSDKFRIENKNNENYEKGQVLAIAYVGGINESYPAQIDVTRIYLIKSN